MSSAGDIPADAAAELLGRVDSAWLADETIQAELLASFRHKALNTLDRLALLAFETDDLLKRRDVTQARKTLSEVGVELQLLSESLSELKQLMAPRRDTVRPLGVLWAELSDALATRLKSREIRLELRRPETFDPLLPGPIVLALTHLVVDGVAGLVEHRGSHRVLVEASPEDRVGARLRVIDSAVRRSEDDDDLTTRLVSALVAHCGGTCETRYDTSGRTVVCTFDVARGVE